MDRSSVILLVLAVVGLAHTAPGKLPSNLKTCKQNDPKFSECLQDAITDALPKFANGVPSLGVQPIDPLEIISLGIGQGGGPVNINLEFNKIHLQGLSSGVMENVKMDPKKYVVDGTVRFKEPIRLQGPYKVDGRILVLPITGDGNCNLTLADLVAVIHVQGEPYTKDGESYMKVQTFDVKFDTSRLYIHLGNLFNGDQALGDNMNTFLNENWSDILKELKDPIETALGASFKHIAGRFFQKVPYNRVFLEK
ncbi:protein takeout [Anabrus simplex]|uniref:protein takeout n=1 Tax=Anabrus simplex TaxID=316456 RepID=UPI0035A3C0FE